MLFFFFSKQKTAYEMRISDWSSDVCSSDLLERSSTPPARAGPLTRFDQVRLRLTDSHCPLVLERTRVITPQNRIEQRRSNMQDFLANYGLWLLIALIVIAAIFFLLKGKASRSEEHTSELQSLMRISYAVFCLKKK